MKLIIELSEDTRVAITRVGLMRISDEMLEEVDKAIQNGKPLTECEDCISREFLKQDMIRYGWKHVDSTVTEYVENLPSVYPKSDNSVLEGIKSEIVGIFKKYPSDMEWYKERVKILDILDKHILDKYISEEVHKEELCEITSDKEGIIKSRFGIDRVFVDKNGYLYDMCGNRLADEINGIRGVYSKNGSSVLEDIKTEISKIKDDNVENTEGYCSSCSYKTDTCEEGLHCPMD